MANWSTRLHCRRLIRAQVDRQFLQKSLEAIRCHFGVPDRVLDVLVAKVVLQGSRIVTIIGELEPAGMAKHVWVDREWHLGGLPDTLHEATEADGAIGPPRSETNTWATLG